MAASSIAVAAAASKLAISSALRRSPPSSSLTTIRLLSSSSSSSSSLSFPLISLKTSSSFNNYNRKSIIRFSTAAPATATTIAVGDKLPDSTLSYFDPAGELQTVTVSELTKGKKAILFAVPGAFTPTCAHKHLPGFVEKAAELKAKGVDTIACISVNDAFVMKAWKENLNIQGDDVLLLSDGNGELTRALGVEDDLSDKPVWMGFWSWRYVPLGLGVRSRRYALLADDGVVKVLNLEEFGALTTSTAQDMLNAL